ncbi:MAG: molybdate ABC transporter substrate-binding protein [Thermoleophilaceae bacterium]|nr:molybdate ABC transporter substrate-binding protein [Thermoleophilaceae bacterium]
MRLLALVLATAALAGAGCGDDSEAGSGKRPRLVVSAASSMTEALEACAPHFAGANVRLQFAGSDELAAQIRQGVKPDVFAAANTSLPVELHADGLLSSPVEFATNQLVLAVPRDSEIDSLGELARQDVKIAIGSASVPIGSYAREALGRLPAPQERAILDNVRSNEPDVRGIVGKLTQDAADAGFIYVTDVEATDGELRSIALPPELQPTVTYGAGVVQGAERPEQAERFVDQLLDGRCADALREAGFRPPPR